MTFRGTFEHALDAKHRLTIPAKFRGALANGVVLAPSHEVEPGAPRTVAIWTPEVYDEYTASSLAGLCTIISSATAMASAYFPASHKRFTLARRT